MKKLVLIALAFFTINAIAQKPENKHHDKSQMKQIYKDMSAEELAELKTKEMTLHLDLDENQQSKVMTLMLAEAKDRKKRMEERQKNSDGEKQKLTKDDYLKMKNERLDAQIAMKKAMKSILNDEQYEKFEKSMAKKKRKRKVKSQRKKH